jgi:hypothetical protein
MFFIVVVYGLGYSSRGMDGVVEKDKMIFVEDEGFDGHVMETEGADNRALTRVVIDRNEYHVIIFGKEVSEV